MNHKLPFKMLLLTLILCICNFSLIQSMSFMDYPLRLDKGNRIIHASLTDKESGRVWQIEEEISSGDRIQGKINVISSKDQKFSKVYYSFKSGFDNNKRLVMQNANCDLYLFRNDWDKQFPGVTKPLTNMVLLMGPSFLHRIADSKWTQGKDEVIRGTLMHSATSIHSQKLKVTAYYKAPNDVSIGVTQPSRIVLTGYDPSAMVERDVGETLILDIYLQSVTDQELAERVQPTPGIGCPSYLQDNIVGPGTKSKKIHFLAKDTINGAQVSLKEIHADEDAQTMRLAETHLGFTNNYIYDFNLGIYYQLFSSRECVHNPITLESPGVANGKFSLGSLLWTSGQVQYLGQVVFEHRSGYKARVWESVELDKELESGKYDKVVTSTYLSPARGSYLNGYDVVAASRNAYKKDQSGNYELVEALHRDFYDFDVDLPDAEYEAAFRLGDCFAKDDQRLTLTIHINCDSGKKSNCLKKAEQNSIELRDSLLESFTKTYGLSPLRIVDIEFIFLMDRIEADVTFVQSPNIKDSFPFNMQYIKTRSIIKLHEVASKSEEECMKFQSSYYAPGSAVVFCKDGNVCISTEKPESIADAQSSADGVFCTIYTIPLKNLYRFGQEKSLEDIHDHLIKEIVHDKFSIQDGRTGDILTYEIIDVVASNKKEQEKHHALYYILNYEAKMIPNGNNIIQVPDIKRYSDCYRACSRSEDILCETFTFCENKDDHSCYLSSLAEKEVSNNLTSDINCMTYGKNYIVDYRAHPMKGFKVPTSVSTDLWIDECAAECSASSECFSFQFCEDRCTFGGYYSESNTKFDPGCTLYTPKLSNRYQLTGTDLVNEVLHTELDLDVDQCAVFCYDYNRDGSESCQSFNFCPKSGSPAKCQLTKYKVSDGKATTSPSSNCHNYELASRSDKKKVTPSGEGQSVRISGGGAFGIIMLFLFVGVIVGFVGPYAAMKLRSVAAFRRSSADFNWSRQVDKIEEEQSEIQI